MIVFMLILLSVFLLALLIFCLSAPVIVFLRRLVEILRFLRLCVLRRFRSGFRLRRRIFGISVYMPCRRSCLFCDLCLFDPLSCVEVYRRFWSFFTAEPLSSG